MIKYSVIIVAAGKGIRMKAKMPKPYLKIKGVPIITLSLKVFNNFDAIEDIVIVTHPDWIEYCKAEIVKKSNLKKVKAVLKGGKERQDSVKAGLDFVGAGVRKQELAPTFMFIHDAVRPFVSSELIARLIQESERYDAVVPGISASDTIKKVINGIVEQTLPREQIYEIQTPQLFRLDVLKRAYDKAYSDGFYGTDDAVLAERIGVKVKVVEGSMHNIKITTKEDLLYAERLL